MYQIVVGVDQSEDSGTSLGKAIVSLPIDTADVNITVLHCFEDNPSGASATQIGSVRRLTEQLDDAGIGYTVREDSGNPSDAILSLAADVDADLLVIGGRKRSPTGKALFGSVTQSVILESDRPITVVKT
ncbi:universal stress protein [Halorubraceae archaeon YAN]|nr:universal stress protein [Halorubraceae archaeon YAN]